MSSHPPDRAPENLGSIIEREVIPRLMVAHGSAPVAVQPLVDDRADQHALAPAQTIETFSRLTLARGADLSEAFLREYVRREVPAETLYRGLLAPAARHLIGLWHRDAISYAELTIALGRLQHLVRELDGITSFNGDADANCPTAFFATRPGEQQTFAFYVIEEQFRWNGWRTWIETPTSRDEITAGVGDGWYDLFCMGVTRQAHIEDVSETITAVRRASLNRGLFVIVNGNPFSEHPDLVGAVGADAAASNGEEALEVMDHAKRNPAA